MTRSGNWSRIERLPDDPRAAVMTGNGYWLDGRFYPTHRAPVSLQPLATPRRSLLARMLGR